MGAAWNNRLFAASVGAFYDWAMQREPVAAGYLRLIVGASDLLNAMDVVGEMPDRSAILDVPCGGGVTLRRLRPGQHVRYVAADISPTMLQRARRHVPSECNGTVEFVQCNIEHMPFDDGEFDLVVCFSGLHCLPNPAAAVTEMARCLRPGGRLVADVAIAGRLRRTDVFITAGRRAGIFGPSASLADVRRWLADAELIVNTEHPSGALIHISAYRPTL
jgi:SAM-dependent methyltransferase